MSALSKSPALWVLAGIAWAALALPVSAQSPDPMLLPLLLQEQTLLEDFGADHPQVRAIRERIAAIRAFQARQAALAPSPRSAPFTAKPVIVQAVHTQPIAPQVPAPAIRRASVPVPVPVPVPDFLLHWNREGERERKKLPEPHEAACGVAPNAKPQAELLPWVGMSAAFLVGLLFQMAGLAFVLRRFGSRLLRVQLVGAAANLPEPAAPIRETVSPPSLDLGPTHANELQRKAEARQQQEEALFRQIFEQNLQLHAQLAKSNDASEKR